MGLECGITLIKNKDENTMLDFSYYGRFSTVRDWVVRNCKPGDKECDYLLTPDKVDLLLRELKDIGSWLMSWNNSQLWYFDSNAAYPEAVNAYFYERDFNPAETNMGYKTLQLYLDLLKLDDIYDSNTAWEAIFWISE